MGIGARVANLLRNYRDRDAQSNLVAALQRLVEDMGEKFLVMGITSRLDKDKRDQISGFNNLFDQDRQ